MFESVVNFAADTAVRTGVHSIRRTNLHRHPDVVEIAYALRGGLHVQVSCETFELEPGDFAVINAGDPHLLMDLPTMSPRSCTSISASSARWIRLSSRSSSPANRSTCRVTAVRSR
ncbi:cupin domain-containing protein [Mycolicibacterium porcinum]